MSFFEKNMPAGTPSWVRTARVPTTGSRAPRPTAASSTFPIVDDLATLTWLVNLAALELHVHQWPVTKAGRPRNPDRLVIDLDPGEPAGLHECCQVALLVRDALAERDLTPGRSPAAARACTCTPHCPAARQRRDHGAGQGGRRGAPEGTRR